MSALLEQTTLLVYLILLLYLSAGIDLQRIDLLQADPGGRRCDHASALSFAVIVFGSNVI
jgi:hypothetical protein